MKRTPDISNQRFGKLFCIGKSGHDKHGNLLYSCLCDCGKLVRSLKGDLVQGKKKSCGCGQGRRSHGLSRKNGKKIKLYSVWSAMKDRCLNPRSKFYEYYGGRGISVCQEWLQFDPFYNWAMANGYSEELTIERIDNDDNYHPENCTWIPQSEQVLNTRKTVLITHNGQTKPSALWAKEVGLNRKTFADRLKRGWNMDKALNTPVKRRAIWQK